MTETSQNILTINSGSSSLKIELYCVNQAAELVFSVNLSRIGLSDSRFNIKDEQDQKLFEATETLPNHSVALQKFLDWLHENKPELNFMAVGHRLVHGGSRYTTPQLVDVELMETLRELVPIAPEHLPQAITAIETVTKIYPNLPQVVCFDTAFHRTMPRVAQLYALPRRFAEQGLIRYGFHGLSYEFILQELERTAGKEVAHSRLIVAHLGNGCSMAAIRDGKSVDTTMGFTPTGGLVMSSRSGDLDPGVLLYLLQHENFTPAQLNRLLNKEAGLLGVSGISADMQDLLQRESSDQNAAEAVELFCYQARKYVGALVSVLSGVDNLVFTGGIGENAVTIRERICAGLGFLGIKLNTERNQTNAKIISAMDSRVTVRVIKTNEDLMIVRHTLDVLSKGSKPVQSN